MAEQTWRETDFNDPYADNSDPSQGERNWSDYPKAALAGGESLVGGLGALLRNVGERNDNGPDDHGAKAAAAFGEYTQSLFGELADNTNQSLSPRARSDINASFTDGNFWTLGSLGLKAAGMAPALAATIIPSVLAPGLGTALASSIITGGGMSAATVTDDLYKMTDELSPADLYAQVPYYKELVDRGVPPEKARAEWNDKFIGYKPLVAGLFGAIANSLGPAGQVGRGIAGKGASALAEEGAGLIKRSALSAGEAGVGGAIQGGGDDAAIQQGAIDAGQQKEFDAGRFGEASASGAVTGAVMGAAAGAVFGHGRADHNDNAPPPVDPLVDAALGTPPPTPPDSPSMPGTGASTPPEGSNAPPSASGKEATPGVPVVVPPGGVGEAAPAMTPKMAEVVASGKAASAARRAKKGAPVVEPVTTTEIVSVEPSAPDPAQGAAIDANKAAEIPAVPPADVAAPNPVPEQAPVTPEGNAPPVAPKAEVPEGVRPPEAVQPPIAPETSPSPALPEPTPVEAPAPVASGPRILPDRTAAPDAGVLDTSKNIADMERPVVEDTGPAGKNRTVVEQAARQATRDAAAEIAAKYPPHELEAGLLSKKPKDQVAARKVMMDRAKAIVAAIKEKGVELPKAFRNNAKDGYNPETLLVMEAKRLAEHPQPKPADYQRFMNRELDVRSGAHEQAVAERRAEGDAANKKVAADIDPATLKDHEAPVDLQNPEEQLLGREEEDTTASITGEANEGQARQVPAEVQKSIDDAVAEALRPKETKAPVVEVRKKRTFTREAINPTPEQLKARSDGALNKVKEAIEKAKAERERLIPTKPVEAKVEPKPEPKIIEALPPKVTPELKPAIKAIKEKLAAARKATDTKPTEAQKEAGNYKKGTVSIHGMEIAIENPKGSERTGTDPNGRNWKVKMKHDYGYIKSSTGADGEGIDVHIGPNHDAPHVYVVDQLDANTKAFDEHKAMIGYNDEYAARDAYKAAYSDGKGEARIGDVTRMTIKEFKEWASKTQKERAGMSAREFAQLQREEIMSPVREFELKQETANNKGVVPEGYAQDPESGRFVKPVSSMSAGRMLATLSTDRLHGAAKMIAGIAKEHLTKLAKDVPVHLVTPRDMARLSNRTVDTAPYGYHTYAADGSRQAIFIRSDLLDRPDKLRHTLLHEVTHAATAKALRSDNHLFNNVNRFMTHVWDHIDKNFSPEDRHEMMYGMTGNTTRLNPHEFLAETFSNPKFQDLLATIPMNDQLRAQLNVGSDMPVRTMWDALIQTVRVALRLPKEATTMLEGAIRLLDRTTQPLEREVNDNVPYSTRSYLDDPKASKIERSVKEVIDMIKGPAMAPTKGNPALLGFRTLDNIARASDRYFKGNNPVRTIANLIEKTRVSAIKEFEKAAPTIQKLHNLSQKYKGQVWEDFAGLVHDETMAGVFADRPLAEQKHISKEGPSDSWQRAQHPDLKARYDKLPQDLKDARKEAMKFFTDKQNEAALKLIRNRIVTLFDTPDPEGLANRIHDGTVTDADKALMGDSYDAIAAAGALSKINGPYVPLMRRGNWVVKGDAKVTAPAGAKALAPNEFEFSDKKKASDWAASQSGRPTMRTVYVDKNTGETFGMDNGKKVKLTAQDADAVPAYRVVVQNSHMEMFDTQKQARQRVAELRASGFAADDAVPRRFENYGIQADALSVQMRRMNTALERKADERNMTPEQKHELLSAMNEMSLSMLGSTRVQSRSLPRSYVRGASKDLVRNTMDYAHSMGNYIAKLDNKLPMDKAVLELEDHVRANSADGFAQGRQMISNEINRRIATPNPVSEGKAFNAVTSRILSLSFMDKLMSPSYSVINASQPFMTTAPMLAGKYGIGRTYKHLGRAYAEIGTLKSLKQGIADTVNKMKPGQIDAPTDPVSLIMGRLKDPQERAMFEALIERGAIDTDAGLEITKLVRDQHGIVGKFDTGIGYLEGIGRQMPKTIEAINRSVSALASYRLEMERSGNHDRAVQFAQDTVNSTQFNYSKSNAAPYMNHPALRLALQFKKYGVGMYQMLGEQIGIAMKNENPGDRAAAIKSLSYTIGMHVLVAGAMGLPTEPIKLAVTAANAMGVVDWSWGDVENAQREAAASIFGKDFGEAVSRGLPRLAGIDLSSRMGIDTLMGPFGEPRSTEAQDLKSYMWDAVSGAPAGLALDWVRGINDITTGDYARAAERLVPIKAFSDSIKAYRTMTEGSVSESSGRQVMSPYSIGEGIKRGLGFAPAREAESFERSSAFHRGKDAQDQERTQFMQDWVGATGAAKGRVWKEVLKWNRAQPAEARLGLSDLKGYQSKIKRDMKDTKEGIRARKREEHIVNKADATYNYLP